MPKKRQEIGQKYAKDSVDSHRRMNRKAKTGGNKKDRQNLRKELEQDLS